MALDRSAVQDSWDEIAALERETRALLDSVRGGGKPKANPAKASSSNSLSAAKTALLSAQNNSGGVLKKGSKTLNTPYGTITPTRKPTADSTSSSRNARSTHEASRPVIPTVVLPSKATVEILDDASPDVTPRGDYKEDDVIAAHVAEKEKYMSLESKFRNLGFQEEVSRVDKGEDSFIPHKAIGSHGSVGRVVSVAEIEAERARLMMLQESAQAKWQKEQQERKDRRMYLATDRAALLFQKVYRGHLGRQKASLTRKLRDMAAKDTDSAVNLSEWIEVVDSESGQSWYYNQRTQESRWDRPESYTRPTTADAKLPTLGGSGKKKSKKSSKKSLAPISVDGHESTPATKTLSVSMSLPSMHAVKTVAKTPMDKNMKSPTRTHVSTTMAPDTQYVKQKRHEMQAMKEVEKELGIHKLREEDSLIAPDGTFKPQLRTVVLDALLDTRFDNISTVLADPRWFDEDRNVFEESGPAQFSSTADSLSSTVEKPKLVDPSRKPMVAVMKVGSTKKKKVDKQSTEMYRGVVDDNNDEEMNNPIRSTKDLTIREFDPVALEDPGALTRAMANSRGVHDPAHMCFGCWSAGGQRKCSLHEDPNHRILPSQTMLLCRNWDLDIKRRKYRSEEIQELFMRQEQSLRYDLKHKQFYTTVEQRHPIYRFCSQLLEKYNDRMVIFEKVRSWLRSLPEAYRTSQLSKKRKRSSLLDAGKSHRNLSMVIRYSETNRSKLPLAPITGRTFPELQGDEKYLFQHYDQASGEMVDLIYVEPVPVPKELYMPHQYHVHLSKTFPLGRSGLAEGAPMSAVLPSNHIISDMNPAAWLEQITSSLVKEGVEMACAQVRAITPISPVDVQQISKRPAPSTMKFAVQSHKPTPGNLAVGGLPIEQLVYQVISTYFPPQYGNFMVMDKSAVSPGITPETNITFQSLIMPPTVETYVERALEHPLTYRRAPTITVFAKADKEEKFVCGANRPEQTGEQESHGFRTSSWSPMLLIYEEIDPHMFVPSLQVVSLNKASTVDSWTTRADSTYPFCEPSTRENSTLDYYSHLLSGVVSTSKAQVFTTLSVQESGEFLEDYRSDLPMGTLSVSVYRSWAFTQQDTIQEYYTDDNIPYWYHRKTGQTFWERPLHSEEEVSPLHGGLLLDTEHPDAPTMITMGETTTQARYLQGEFRKAMLSHIETKQDALHRRKAAKTTLFYAKERGLIQPTQEMINQSHFASTGMIASAGSLHNASQEEHHLELPESLHEFSILPNSEGLSQSQQKDFSESIPLVSTAIDDGEDDLMRMYETPSPIVPNTLLPGNSIEDDSVASLDRPPRHPGVSTSQNNAPIIPNFNQLQQPSNTVAASTSNVLAIPGIDPNVMTNLSQTLGHMFATMMQSDQINNPQGMISLGLGMGMALMSSGAANTVANHGATVSNFLTPSFDGSTTFPSPGFERPAGMDDSFSVTSAQPSPVVDLQNTTTSAHREPIGLVSPNVNLSTEKPLDHQEEHALRQQVAMRLTHPITAVEKARGLTIKPDPTITPDMAPEKVLTDECPANADIAMREAVPLLAYPEISSSMPDGTPVAYNLRAAAGYGRTFVNETDQRSQVAVPNAPHLKRTVLPLPSGFFQAIEAKHVAPQTADYLPQVPNLPQARTIGRVKPRSAAADWLLINFDPWSAGKKPLTTEFVSSLMEKADRLIGIYKAAEQVDQMRNTTLRDAYVNVEDDEGLAEQRAAITQAQVLAEEFKRLCSLCRHGKFSDAEQLINQPDWAVPIDYQDEFGNATIHVAAQNGNRRLIKLCMRRGCNLNIQNLNGQTALHFAYSYGYKEVGEYLVSKGANDAIRNKDGLTCYEGLGARELQMM